MAKFIKIHTWLLMNNALKCILKIKQKSLFFQAKRSYVYTSLLDDD